MSITLMKGCVFMPRFNGTGPNGEGPLTGRGLGQCNTSTENQNGTFSLSYGCGRQNRGKFCFNNRGFRFNVPNDNEKEYLTQQASILEGQLQKIKNRINEL